MDYLSLAQIFKGVVKSGCWAVFDEFNRMVIEVISVIGEQLSTILTAQRNNQKEVILENTVLKLDRRFQVFITMNPGYLGRAELPHSIDALFRPIQMAVPDLKFIIEIMLLSEGILKARTIAVKIWSAMMISRTNLSKQAGYDFGLRAIKQLISYAGVLKRANPE
jgi:dynein heavy chain